MTDNFNDPVEYFTNDLERHRDDYEAYIGEKKINYYMPKFRNFFESDNKISWNWPAFFVGPLWMVYRKLYSFALVLWVVELALGLIPRVGSLLSFVLNILVAMFANYLYFTKAEKEVNEFQSITNPMDRRDFLARKGGTNKIAVIILMILSMILSLLFAFMLDNVDVTQFI